MFANEIVRAASTVRVALGAISSLIWLTAAEEGIPHEYFDDFRLTNGKTSPESGLDRLAVCHIVRKW